MVTKTIKPAIVERVCDMCGDAKEHFVSVGHDNSVCRGYVQSQSDRWEKLVSIKITTSIPYQSSSDLCTDCAKESFMQVIRDIENETISNN